ncbi:MAG: hypothetical protein QM817_28615 [Archangium sp.]
MFFTWILTMAAMGVCAAVSIGVGALVSPLLGVKSPDALRSFWWGVVASMVLLFTWHIGFAVDGRAAAGLALLGAAGWFVHARALLAGARRFPLEHPGTTAVFLASWALLPWISLQPLTCTDAGLYYIIAVKWHAALPQVPGLQATHPAAVMNAGGFLLFAATGAGFGEQGHLVFNVLLAWWGLPFATMAVGRLWKAGTAGDWMTALAVAPAIDQLTSDRNSCPSLDVGVLWLGLAMVAIAFSGSAAKVSPLRSALAFLLLAPLYKLSLVPFALFLVLTLLVTRFAEFQLRATLVTLAAVALAAVPFLVGNVIVSGYPLYPSAVMAFPTPWTLPRTLPVQISDLIRRYARHNALSKDAGDWERFERLLLMNRAVLLPFVLGIGGTIAALVKRRGVVLALVAWAYAAVWFAVAPDPRFAGVALWAFSALTLGAALRSTSDWNSPLATSLPGQVAAVLAAGMLILGDVPQTTMPPLPEVRPPLSTNRPEDWTTLSDGSPFVDCSEARIQCFSLPAGGLFPAGLHRRDVNDLSAGFALPAEIPPLKFSRD